MKNHDELATKSYDNVQIPKNYRKVNDDEKVESKDKFLDMLKFAKDETIKWERVRKSYIDKLFGRDFCVLIRKE